MLIVIALAVVQFGSASLFSSAGAPQSLPAHMSAAWGVRVYTAIERVAPAPFVELMLGYHALAQGNTAAAEHHAMLLPPSATRNELFGRIWQARGQHALALEYYLVAPDVDAVQAEVRRIATVDATAAIMLEERFKDMLESLMTHPDAVADAYWRLGRLQTLEGYREPAQRPVLFNEALRNYRHAVNLAPLSERYLLAAGSEALMLHDEATARRYYLRGIDVDPTSADAYAGLGLVALHAGDVPAARHYASTARAIDPMATILLYLERSLAAYRP